MKIRIKFIIILIIIFFFCIPSILAAQAKLSLSLNRSEASVYDTVQLSVSIDGSYDGDPVIQGLQDFTISKGGTSSQIQIINGHMSKSNEITYFLQPKKSGAFTIGPASITVSGRTISSNTARLTVTGPSTTSSGDVKGPLTLSASLSSNTVYTGQQIVYTLKLYSTLRVNDVSVQLPKTQDISFKQLGNSNEYQTTIGGKQVMAVEVNYLLSVSKPGEYRLEPSTMQMSVFDQSRRSSQNPFDDPFFGARGRPASVSSETLKLSVRDLPKEGRPANFSGLVGYFTIKSQLDPIRVKTGDSANLSVEVSGVGNVNLIPDLSLPDIDGLKIYPDQPKLESETQSVGDTGKKTMKWAIVPQTPGMYELPALSLSYFDTESRNYKLLTSQQLKLAVTSGQSQTSQNNSSGTSGPQGTVLPKAEVEELGRDILPIHTDIRDLHNGFNITGTPLIAFILLVLPFITWLAIFILLRLRHWDSKHAGLIMAKKAADNFSSAFAGQELNAIEAIEAIRTYFNDRFRLNIGLITPEEAQKVLGMHGVSTESADELNRILIDLQLNVYTGTGITPLKTDAGLPRLIRRIDREAK
jgi:hypothetical protein